MSAIKERINRSAVTPDREIVMSRVFDAPREVVWDTFTDPKQVVQWWGPTGFTTTIHEMDVRPGGAWRHTMHGPDGTNYPNKSVFTEVVKPERIVYEHGGGREGGPSVSFEATWTFEAQGGKTLLTGRMVFATAAAREFVVKEHGAIEGGKQTFDRLEEHLEKRSAKNISSSGETAVRDLVITRIFDAPRELVWRAWTDPERMKLWWGPKTFTAPAGKIDLRVGGAFLFCMRSPEGQNFWSTGVYREIVAPSLLVYTDNFADEKGNVVPASHYGLPGDWTEEMVVTVTFEEHEGKTKMTLRHAGLPSGEMSEMTGTGWNGSFDKLAESLVNA